MKLGACTAVIALALASSAGNAFAWVDMGVADFGNGLSRPGLVTCDWSYDSYIRSCPIPILPPKPASKTKPAEAKPKHS